MSMTPRTVVSPNARHVEAQEQVEARVTLLRGGVRVRDTLALPGVGPDVERERVDSPG
jgi:hypothetical protein